MGGAAMSAHVNSKMFTFSFKGLFNSFTLTILHVYTGHSSLQPQTWYCLQGLRVPGFALGGLGRRRDLLCDLWWKAQPRISCVGGTQDCPNPPSSVWRMSPARRISKICWLWSSDLWQNEMAALCLRQVLHRTAEPGPESVGLMKKIPEEN